MRVVIRKTVFGWIVVLVPEQKTVAPPFGGREEALKYCQINGFEVVKT